MSTEVTRTTPPARRRMTHSSNTIAFPTSLRDAIPDLPTYAGRVLELESIEGNVNEHPLLGPPVAVKMVAVETGKLKGKFNILVGLQPEAARALAETLLQLAKRMEG